jgi:hypothetical protein
MVGLFGFLKKGPLYNEGLFCLSISRGRVTYPLALACLFVQFLPTQKTKPNK